MNNQKKYFLDDYVKTKKKNLEEEEAINDFHVNHLYLNNKNTQNEEEKVAIFKNEDSFLAKKSTSNTSVPGQNISFLFYYSIFFSLAISLIITILLKTQKYIGIDSNFPRRVYLESFFLGNFSYANKSFSDELEPISAFSNISCVLIDESILVNPNNSKQIYFQNKAFAENGIDHPLFSLYNNSFDFNQDYGRDLQIHPDVIITGRLKASSISFGPFRIEHNTLTNTKPSNSQLLSLSNSDIVTNFLLKDEYLIVVETNTIFVFYIDHNQINSIFKPEIIYTKSYYNKEKISQIISSKDNVFTFIFDDNNKDETASIECKNKQCEESDYIYEKNNDSFSEIFNKFGAKIELNETKNKKCQLSFCFDNDKKDCSIIPIQIHNSVGCGSAKVSVNEDGNAYVVIPEKKIVRIFEDMNDKTAYTDEPLDIQVESKYQPIQMSSYVIALNEGILEVFSF